MPGWSSSRSSTGSSPSSLTFLSASDKTEVKLTPTGENKLMAKGTFKVQSGTTIAGVVTLAGKANNVKFALK